MTGVEAVAAAAAAARAAEFGVSEAPAIAVTVGMYCRNGSPRGRPQIPEKQDHACSMTRHTDSMIACAWFNLKADHQCTSIHDVGNSVGW